MHSSALVVATAVLLSACSLPEPIPRTIRPHFFGDYRLSARDGDAMVSAARPRIEQLLPGAVIFSVHVFDARSASLTFGRDWRGPIGDFHMVKHRGMWRIEHETIG